MEMKSSIGRTHRRRELKAKSGPRRHFTFPGPGMQHGKNHDMADDTFTTEDRKPHTLTVDGIKLTFDPGVVDDFELIADLNDAINGDGNGQFKIASVVKKLTGSEYNKVMNGLRDPDTGRVPVAKVNHFIAELFRKALPNS